MFGNQGMHQHGFDSREALRDTNPEMGGAFEVARQRQGVILSGVINLRRQILPQDRQSQAAAQRTFGEFNLVETAAHQGTEMAPQSQEVQHYTDMQEMRHNYDPVAEAEAINRQATEQKKQAAMGASAREQLQGMPDTTPQVPDATAYTPPAPVSDIQNHVSYISRIADQRYNGNLPGMN